LKIMLTSSLAIGEPVTGAVGHETLHAVVELGVQPAG
jgi:hypothetical protein